MVYCLKQRITICIILVFVLNILFYSYNPQPAQAATFVEAFNSVDLKDAATTTADWDLDSATGHLLNGSYRQADDGAGYESVTTTEIADPIAFMGSDGQPVIVYRGGGSFYAQKWSASLESWSDLEELTPNIQSRINFGYSISNSKVIKLKDGKFGILANILVQNIPGNFIANLYYTQWTPNAGPAVCGSGHTGCFTNAAGTVAGIESISNPGLSYNTHQLNNFNETIHYQLLSDNYDQPSVMWMEQEAGNMNFYFTRWNGSAWTKADRTTLGKEKILSLPGIYSGKLNFIFNNEELYAIFGFGTGSYLAKWDGSNWQNLAGTNFTLPGGWPNLTKYAISSKILDLKIDNNGQLMAGVGAFSNGEGTFIARWQTSDNKWHYPDGTAIDDIDTMTTLFPGNSLGYWGFSVDKSNNVLVWMINGELAASELYFTQWKGSAWVKADGVTAGYEAVSNVTSGVFLHLSSQYVLDNNQYPVFMFNQFNGSSPTSLLLSRFTGRSIKGGNKVTNSQDTAIGTMFWYFGASYDSATQDILILGQGLDTNKLIFTKFKEHIYPTNNQYLQSKTIAVPHNNTTQIARATLTASYNVPNDTSLVFQMSANGGTNWDTVTPGVERVFTNPGTDLRWRALFSRTDMYKTATLEYIIINTDAKVVNASEDVMITASVDPELSITLSATSCNFETFSATTIRTCNYSTIVNTNSVNGYLGYIEADGDLRTTISGQNIDNIAGLGPNSTKIDYGYEEYGIATSDTDTVAVTAKVANCGVLNGGTTAVDAVALSGKMSYALATGPVTGDTVTLCHAAAISGGTSAGNYGQTITITVVSNY